MARFSLLPATRDSFEIRGHSERIFHLDHTKRFEGGAINLVHPPGSGY